MACRNSAWAFWKSCTASGCSPAIAVSTWIASRHSSWARFTSWSTRARSGALAASSSAARRPYSPAERPVLEGVEHAQEARDAVGLGLVEEREVDAGRRGAEFIGAVEANRALDRVHEPRTGDQRGVAVEGRQGVGQLDQALGVEGAVAEAAVGVGDVAGEASLRVEPEATVDRTQLARSVRVVLGEEPPPRC